MAGGAGAGVGAGGGEAARAPPAAGGGRPRRGLGPAAPVLLRDRRAKQADVAVGGEDVLRVLARLVELGGARGHLLAGDAAGGIADQLVGVGEAVVPGGCSR